eukprot:7865574-Pyramimonas_sp.AAC.1
MVHRSVSELRTFAHNFTNHGNRPSTLSPPRGLGATAPMAANPARPHAMRLYGCMGPSAPRSLRSASAALRRGPSRPRPSTWRSCWRPPIECPPPT